MKEKTKKAQARPFFALSPPRDMFSKLSSRIKNAIIEEASVRKKTLRAEEKRR